MCAALTNPAKNFFRLLSCGDEIKYENLRRAIFAWSARRCHLWDRKQRSLLKKIRNESGWSVSLGSGRRPFDGWLLVDAEPNGPENYLRHDLRRPLPFRDDSVERILIEHYLEHCDARTEVPRLLKECRRILKSGGALRIVVPDAEAFVRAYVSGDAESWQKLGWDIKNLPQDMPTPMSVLNHVFHQNGEHKAGWDFITLKHALEKTDFREVEKMSFGKSRDATMNIDRPHHAPYSLYVEAIK